jgi:hypothetical protein
MCPTTLAMSVFVEASADTVSGPGIYDSSTKGMQAREVGHPVSEGGRILAT